MEMSVCVCLMLKLNPAHSPSDCLAAEHYILSKYASWSSEPTGPVW